MEYSCNSTQFNSTINIGLIHQPQQPFWVNLKMFLWKYCRNLTIYFVKYCRNLRMFHFNNYMITVLNN